MNESILKPMLPEDIDESVDLIRTSMNAAEAEYARETMEFHFACNTHGIADGRHYFVWREGGRIRGLTGLHHWHWGPKENVWLAWFAVHPDYQGKGIGSRLLGEIEKRAGERGYVKLFVETYEHPDFARAMSFYRSKGFRDAGRVEGYLPDGSAMVVLVKEPAGL